MQYLKTVDGVVWVIGGIGGERVATPEEVASFVKSEPIAEPKPESGMGE